VGRFGERGPQVSSLRFMALQIVKRSENSPGGPFAGAAAHIAQTQMSPAQAYIGFKVEKGFDGGGLVLALDGLNAAQVEYEVTGPAVARKASQTDAGILMTGKGANIPAQRQDIAPIGFVRQKLCHCPRFGRCDGRSEVIKSFPRNLHRSFLIWCICIPSHRLPCLPCLPCYIPETLGGRFFMKPNDPSLASFERHSNLIP
jgi:hypothetical protein